jgi:hypothetical protein
LKSSLLAAIIVVIFVLPGASQTFFDFIPKPGKTYEIREDKIYFRQGPVGIIVEVASDATLLKYYADRGAKVDSHPFTKLGEAKNYTIFIVTLINRSQGAFTFTPRYVTLKAKDKSFYPLDFPLLLELFQDIDPARRRLLELSVFHSSEALPRDQIATKLLVFSDLPSKADDLTLEFDYLYFESKEIRTKFYFERKKTF